MTETECENARLRNAIAQLERRMSDVTRGLKGDEPEQLKAIETRADSAYAVHGQRPPVPSLGETPLQYRRRVLDGLKKYSAKFHDARFDGADHAMMDVVEPIILRDAVDAAGKSGQPGMLVAERYRDEAGRLCTKWHGDPLVWMQHFSTGAAVGRIDRDLIVQKGGGLR